MGKWPLVRLGDVCEIGAGQGAPQGVDKYCRQGTPFIKAGNLADLVNGCSENEIQQVNDEVAKEYALRIYPKGTIVFAKSGMSCMKGYVYKLKRDCYVVNHLACVIPRKVYGSYLKYCLEKYPPNRLIKDASYPSISLSDIANLKIPLPPLNVQKHIANVLDKTQEIIDGYKKQLAELDILIKAVFYEMFGDPAANEKEWEVKSLKEISEKPLSYGSGASATDYNGDVRYIRITDINDDGSLNRDVVSPNVIDTKYILNDGDILFARSGATVGKTLRFRESFGKCIYAGYLIRFVPKEKFVLPDYVYYYTKTNLYRRFIGSNIKTVAQPNINARQYGELKVVIPPLDLQNKFAEIVTKIDEQKALVKRAITESEHLFNSLMSEYFD